MNLFVIYLYKTLSYQRSDIRGTKSTGDKRRLAWPEMLTVILPLYWAINIVTNALAFLRAVEGSCGNIVVSVQVNGFQWGWKYCYNDTFYTKFFNTPVLAGNNKLTSLNGISLLDKPIDDMNDVLEDDRYSDDDELEFHKYETKLMNYWTRTVQDVTYDFYNWPEANSWKNFYNLTSEHLFCREWLKRSGRIENEFTTKNRNKRFQHGYWVISQGLNPDSIFINEKLNRNNLQVEYTSVKDPLRLLRASGALVLPTRSNIRLMGCSDDITHSWAVPALGIKMDCVPGRLFFFYTNIVREGIYFGQCSELCGWNHYNMPIVLYALPIEHFITWWEIELHSLFNKKLLKKLNFMDRASKHYKLINFKYK